MFNYFFALGEEREHYRTGSSISFRGNDLYGDIDLAMKCKNGYILNGDSSRRRGSFAHQAKTRAMAHLHWFFQTHIKSMRKLKEMIKEYNKRADHYAGIDLVNPEKALSCLEKDHAYRGWNDDFTKENPTPADTCPICQQFTNGHEPLHHCIIPFSSLHGPRLEVEDLTIVDVATDTYEKTGKFDKNGDEIKIHHLGASLVRCGRRRFLSSIDASSKRHQFFLVELKSRRVNSVEGAYRDLAGNLTDEQYQRYKLGEIQRQGEFFFEEKPDLKTRELKKTARNTKVRMKGVLDVRRKTQHMKEHVKKSTRRYLRDEYGYAPEQVSVVRRDGIPFYVLFDKEHMGQTIPGDAELKPGSDSTVSAKGLIFVNETLLHQFDLSGGDGHPHCTRDFIQTPDGMFARGTVRHPEHEMIRLGNTWNQVFVNTALGSWAAHGRVD